MNTIKQFFFVAATALFAASCVKVNFNEDTALGGSNPDDPNVSRALVGSYERDISLSGGTYTIKGYVYFASGIHYVFQKVQFSKVMFHKRGPSSLKGEPKNS